MMNLNAGYCHPALVVPHAKANITTLAVLDMKMYFMRCRQQKHPDLPPILRIFVLHLRAAVRLAITAVWQLQILATRSSVDLKSPSMLQSLAM